MQGGLLVDGVLASCNVAAAGASDADFAAALAPVRAEYAQVCPAPAKLPGDLSSTLFGSTSTSWQLRRLRPPTSTWMPATKLKLHRDGGALYCTVPVPLVVWEESTNTTTLRQL